MGWSAAGVAVSADWHVFAGGRWRVEAVPVGRTAPVNVYVTPDRMAPVVYRHRAGECQGQCVLTCGQGDTREVLRLVCSACCDTAPDADVMGEGVSLGALCGFPTCGGTYREVAGRCWCGGTPDDDEPCAHG